MTTRTLAVVSAGLSTPSSTRLLADRLTAATVAALRARGDRRHRRGRRAARARPRPGRQPAHRLPERVRCGRPWTRSSGADGLIAVTPIFSASYSGLFKTFFDVLDKDALAGKPVLMGATAGTARHSLALEHAMRPLFAYLRAVAVPTAVFAAPEDWAGGGGAGRALADRIERAAGELADLVTAGRPPAGAGRPVRRPDDVLRGAAPRQLTPPSHARSCDGPRTKGARSADGVGRRRRGAALRRLGGHDPDDLLAVGGRRAAPSPARSS